jgi:VWFA-related protein
MRSDIRMRLLAVVGVFAMVLSGVAGAVTTGDPETSTLYVTVQERGAPVPGLTARNFRVHEDGIPQRLVRVEPAGPAHVVLLVENNLTSWTFLNDVHSAMRGFLEAAPQGYMYALVTYGRSANVEARFTPDIEAIRDAYAGLRRVAYQDTDTLDAIYLVAEELERLPGRRVILLIGSGLDTFSRRTFGQLQQKLEAVNVLVYSLATGSDLRRDRPAYPEPPLRGDLQFGEMLMRMMAVTTGGGMYCPSCAADYADSMRQIMESLESQYAVTYERPAQAAAGFRKVKVESFRLEGDYRKNLKVVVREGWRF